MRQQPRLAALFAIALLLSFAVEAHGAEPVGSVEWAEKARAVFRRHCLRCHGEKARGGVRILEQPPTVDGRALFVPGKPDRSILLDLVEGGSMPPGRLAKLSGDDVAVLREWIKAGAAAFPAETGQDYLLRRLVDDFRDVPVEKKPYVRYLSLNHLAPDKARRKAVSDALRAVLRVQSRDRARLVEPEAVEPTGTLLRIDLRELGWESPAFDSPTPNLFDLLLLEYPYGVLPNAPFSPELSTFLRQTKQVRPIPYVRIDWLIRALTTDPLYTEFLYVLGKPRGVPPPSEAIKLLEGDSIQVDDAVRELETSVSILRLQGVLGGLPALSPLLRKEAVKRVVWESHFLEVARRLDIGTPILPLDGLSSPDYNPDPDLKVEIRLVDPKDPDLPLNPKVKKRFVANKDSKDHFQVWIRSSQDVEIELVYTNSEGSMKVLSQKSDVAEANVPLLFPRGKDSDEGFEATSPGLRSITLFAYPQKSLDGEPYRRGQWYGRDGMQHRFVHGFYALDKEGNRLAGPDPARMVKITVQFNVVKR